MYLTLVASLFVLLHNDITLSQRTSETIDVYRHADRAFTVVRDQQGILWLGEVFANGTQELIGPIPGMIGDPRDDSIAGSWAVQGNELIYLAGGTPVSRPLDWVKAQQERLPAKEWFHRGVTDFEPSAIGTPIDVAIEFERSVFGPSLIAISAASGGGRAIGVLYEGLPAGRLQVWERTGKGKQSDAADREEASLMNAQPILDANDADTGEPKQHSNLVSIASGEYLHPDWSLIAHTMLDLQPPLEVLVSPETITIIDRTGSVFWIRGGSIVEAGAYANWDRCSELVRLRDVDGDRFYGRVEDEWRELTLQLADEGGASPQSELVNAALKNRLDAYLTAQARLVEQILLGTDRE